MRVDCFCGIRDCLCTALSCTCAGLGGSGVSSTGGNLVTD